MASQADNTTLQPGTLANFSGSMAEAMEKAFLAEWPNVMINQPVPNPTNQMRLLFVAIAQGVVGHLAANADAITIIIGETREHTHPADVEITTEGLIPGITEGLLPVDRPL
jgi:hypothetical protein